MKFVIALVLLALLLLSLRMAMPKLGTSKARGPVDINGEWQLADCPETPNCQCSQASRSEQKVAALDLSNRDKPINYIASVVSQMSGATVVTQDDHYLHVTFQSAVLNFTDDVEFLHQDDSTQVQVRSASRLGVSDLGANLKRIETLRQLLQ